MSALFIVLLLWMQPPAAQGQRVVDLRGSWDFRLGDNPDADGGWASLFVPAAWENEGWPGYDGFAWYQRQVRLPDRLPAGELYLDLGRIDDADAVYVNGRLIGKSGAFPPRYRTAYDRWRRYRIPDDLALPGAEWQIRIRVYDDGLQGGLLEGRPGIYVESDPDRLVDLAGIWKFRTGDAGQYARVVLDDRHWDDLPVPGRWDAEGLEGYDGFGWYRTRFTLPPLPDGETWYLWLGRIDDADQVYLNGMLIGATGVMDPQRYRNGLPSPWQQQRVYALPPQALRVGVNVLALRVLDVELDGGLYEGPVGIYRTGGPRASDTWWRRMLDW